MVFLCNEELTPWGLLQATRLMSALTAKSHNFIGLGKKRI